MDNTSATFYLTVTALLLLGFLADIRNVEALPECSEAKLGGEDKMKCMGGFAWNCSYLNLKQVPTSFPKRNLSRKLCLLNLSWNRLTTIDNSAFKNLKDLKWLLNQNNLTKIEPVAFVGLGQLLYLHLSSNKLEYPNSLTDQVFEPLVNLEYLNLKNNPVQTYDALDRLLKPLRKTLKGLLISGCYNCTFGQGFENFSNLISLSLSGLYSNSGETLCNISTLLNETFIHLPKLKELFISFCNIGAVEPGAFSPLKNIKTVDISYNRRLQFRGMRDVLSGLVNSSICILDVSAIHERFERGTELLKEHIEPIQYLKKLKVLYIELNKLEVINEQVFDLIPKSTSHFMLSGNRLTYGKYVEKLSTMKHIVAMDLSRQHLNYDPFIQKHQEHDSPTGTVIDARHRFMDNPEWNRPTKKESSMTHDNHLGNFQFCADNESVNENEAVTDLTNMNKIQK